MRFWDSSAIVPLLVAQSPSFQVNKWLAEDADLAIWTLTPVEVASALWRLVREGALSDSQALAADSRARQLEAASHVIVDVEAVKLRAGRILRLHSLRAADAAQLAAALVWAGDSPQGKSLRTLDDRLALAARREGFDVA